MGTWTSDELDTIGGAEELEIAPVRDDGTQRKPVTIWVVRDRDDIYVRSANIADSVVAPNARAATLKLVPR